MMVAVRSPLIALVSATLVVCGPIGSAIYTNRGSALYEEGHYTEAAQHYRKAIEIDSTDGPARIGLGNALWQLGRREECLQAYADATKVAPDYAPAYYGLAYYEGEMGRLPDAQRTLTDFERRHPSDARVHAELGVIYMRMHAPRLAIHELDRAANLNSAILNEVPRFAAARREANRAAAGAVPSTRSH